MNEIQYSNFPEDALRFFHGLTNWVEDAKRRKPKLISWRAGAKRLTQLCCVKPKPKEPLIIPAVVPKNTLYIPTSMGALDVLRHIRHAFCHNDIVYNANSKEYTIKRTEQVKIGGRFTLQAIEELVEIFVQANND